jgi:predicted DNA-binding transcriptional regulator AlpA
MSKLDQFISATEAAQLAGIERDTFTSYVSRGFAPEPVGVFGGRRVYERATIEAWAAKRSGNASE